MADSDSKYDNVLKAALTGMAGFWAVSGINSAPEAGNSFYAPRLAGLFPQIFSIAAEMNYFYGTDIELREYNHTAVYDLACDAYKLGEEIIAELPFVPRLAESMNSPHFNLPSLLNYALSREEGDDFFKCCDRLKAALAFQKLALDVSSEKMDAKLRADIQKRKMEQPLLAELPLNAGIPQVCAAIYNTCRDLSCRRKSIGENDINRCLYQELRKSRCIRKNFPPFRLSDDLTQSFSQMILRHRDGYRQLQTQFKTLAQAEKKLPFGAMPEEVNEILIKEKAQRILPVSPLQKADMRAPDMFEMPSLTTETASPQLKADLLAAPHWRNYEKAEPLSRPLRQKMCNLVGAWLCVLDEEQWKISENVEQLREFNEDGDINQERFELEKQISSDALRLLHAEIAARKYLGLNMNENGYEPHHLKTPRRGSAPLSDDYLAMVDNVIDSFALNTEDISVSYEDFRHRKIPPSFARELEELPDNLEKFKLAAYSRMALNDLYRDRREGMVYFRQLCLDEIKAGHTAETETLTDFVTSYFQNRSSDAAGMAERLDTALSQNFLLPFYREEKISGNALQKSVETVAGSDNLTAADKQFLHAVSRYHLANIRRVHGTLPHNQELQDNLNLYGYEKAVLDSFGKSCQKIDAVYQKMRPEYQAYQKFIRAERQVLQGQKLTLYLLGQHRPHHNN